MLGEVPPSLGEEDPGQVAQASALPVSHPGYRLGLPLWSDITAATLLPHLAQEAGVSVGQSGLSVPCPLGTRGLRPPRGSEASQ